jgi:6-phosphogluconolactonase (cycloisomerase 2 family)
MALDWSEDYLYVLSAQSHNVTQFIVQEDGRLKRLRHAVPAGLGPAAIVGQRGLSKQP